jgi:glucan 1,3-beta-glucosidase
MDVLPGGRGGTQQYTQQAADAIRSAGYGGAVVFSDGFAQSSSWNGFLSGQNAIVDHHEYQVFTDELLELSYQGHVDYVYSNAGEWAGGVDKPVVMGEWTAAMTDCAPALV